MTISAVVTETNINASVTQLSNSVALTETAINASVSQTPISANVTTSPISASITGIAPVSVAVSQTNISASVSGGGGVTDHALLSNLDYASAAHTGFQATLTADVDYLTPATAAATYQTLLTLPLTPNLGGTGIANLAGSTLTLGGATTISTGGTIALGGFTLTIPATLTVAGLAIANVFTVNQMIDGTADQIQLRVQGHSTQTANLQTWENSAGAVGAFITPTGNMVLGPTALYSSLAGLSINKIITISDNYTFGFDIRGTYTAGASYNAYGMHMAPILYGGQNINGFYSGLIANTVPGNIAYARGGYIASMTKVGSGTVSYVMGLWIASQTIGASGNYAIYTETGINRFGDIVNTTASYQVDGTQVVSNRVVDARIDDTPNSGDATTDGIIAAIQAALQTHGLVTAA